MSTWIVASGLVGLFALIGPIVTSPPKEAAELRTLATIYLRHKPGENQRPSSVLKADELMGLFSGYAFQIENNIRGGPEFHTEIFSSNKRYATFASGGRSAIMKTGHWRIIPGQVCVAIDGGEKEMCRSFSFDRYGNIYISPLFSHSGKAFYLYRTSIGKSN